MNGSLHRSLMLFMTILTLAISAAVSGQQETLPYELKTSLDVVLVEVPVTVVDRSGNAVRGLTKNQFALFDNGARVEPSFFETFDLASAGETDTAEVVSRHPVTSRNFLLLFDLNTISLKGLGRAQEAAKQFISSDIGGRDTVAVATFNAGSGIRLLAGFTRNREILEHAIDTLGHQDHYRIGDPLRIGFLVDKRVGAGDSWGQGDVYVPPDPTESAGSRRADRAPQLEAIFRDANRLVDRTDDDHAEAMVRKQLEGLSDVASLLDSIPGQKQILFLTEGFDNKVITGRDSEAIEGRNEFEAGVRGEVWRINTDQRFGRTSVKEDLNTMAEVFRRADVVLHTFDVGGVRSTTDASTGFQRNSNESLFLISNPTGGRVFKNQNDMKKNFDNMLREQEVVYLLGFHANRTGEAGGYHELRVEVSDLPFGTTVRHRTTYYERTGGPGLERALSASEIFAFDIPRTDIVVTPTVLALPPDGRKKNVPVFLQIDGQSLSESLANETAMVEVMIYAFSETDAAVDYAYDLVAVSGTSREGILSSGLGYYAELRLPPGKYSIKALVRDRRSGKDGFARTNVTIPDAGELAIVGPFLIEGPRDRTIFWKDEPAKPESMYPLGIEKRIAVPSSHPLIQPGGSYIAALLVAGATGDLSLDSLMREVSTKREIPTRLNLMSRTPGKTAGTELLLFEFQPTEISSWVSYVLEIGVTSRGSRQIHTVSFEGGSGP